LLVHHGGSLTSSYLRQHNLVSGGQQRVFMDSLTITHANAIECLEFVEGIVRKTFVATKRAMQECIAGIDGLPADKVEAVESLDMYL
jgi:hypothetical protein